MSCRFLLYNAPETMGGTSTLRARLRPTSLQRAPALRQEWQLGYGEQLSAETF